MANFFMMISLSLELKIIPRQDHTKVTIDLKTFQIIHSKFWIREQTIGCAQPEEPLAHLQNNQSTRSFKSIHGAVFIGTLFFFHHKSVTHNELSFTILAFPYSQTCKTFKDITGLVDLYHSFIFVPLYHLVYQTWWCQGGRKEGNCDGRRQPSESFPQVSPKDQENFKCASKTGYLCNKILMWGQRRR